MTADRIPQPMGFFARIFNWRSEKSAPVQPDQQNELHEARKDIDRLQGELDDMAITIESKDRQIRASAEALARANGDAASQRRLANSLQQKLDGERRFIKQQAAELAEARRNRKRR